LNFLKICTNLIKMNVKKLFFILFSVSILLSVAACKRYTTIENDEYILKIPNFSITSSKQYADSTSLKITHNNDEYSVWVIRKNKFEFLSLNDCVSKELAYYIESQDYSNITTKNTQINGKNAIIISGVTKTQDFDCYWSFAIIPTDFFYYIIRVSSHGGKFTFNEYYNSEIINSFILK